MDVIIPNKCYSCGKTFRDERDFNRHKNRKTPCLIREIADADLKNPLRCIYCNKILSKKSHLERHHGVCKVKNGGLELLYDKTKYEETIRIMKEETDRKLDEKDQKILEMQKVMEENAKQMYQKMEEMQKTLLDRMQQMAGCKTDIGNQTVGNQTVVNGHHNTVNNIAVNNFTDPAAEHLLEFETFKRMLSHEELRYPVALILDIYFDPLHPENASIHLLDKDTKHVLAMADGRWNTYTMNKIVEQMRNLGYNLAMKGCERYFQPDSPKEQLEFIRSKHNIIERIIKRQNHPDAERADWMEIEEKLFSEFINSSRHPAVVSEHQRLRKEIAYAKKK